MRLNCVIFLSIVIFSSIGACDFLIKLAEAEVEDDRFFFLGAALWLSSLFYIACLQVEIKNIFHVKDIDIIIGCLRELPLVAFGIIGVAAPILRLLEYYGMF